MTSRGRHDRGPFRSEPGRQVASNQRAGLGLRARNTVAGCDLHATLFVHDAPSAASLRELHPKAKKPTLVGFSVLLRTRAEEFRTAVLFAA